jgi:hypothetical protein
MAKDSDCGATREFHLWRLPVADRNPSPRRRVDNGEGRVELRRWGSSTVTPASAHNGGL